MTFLPTGGAMRATCLPYYRADNRAAMTASDSDPRIASPCLEKTVLNGLCRILGLRPFNNLAQCRLTQVFEAWNPI